MSDETPTPHDVVELHVGVYRVQVDEWDETDETKQLQKERHDARGAAVKAEFQDDPDGIRVLAWGNTEAEEPHELVELVVEVVTSPQVQGAAASVLTWIGLKLADKGLDSAISADFTAVARKIFRTQKAEPRVNDAWINAGNQRYPELHLYPPEWSGGSTVAAIDFADGSRIEFHPPPGGWTGAPELDPPEDRLSS